MRVSDTSGVGIGPRGSWYFWTDTVMAQDGVLLLGLSLIVTILGMQVYYRIRRQPINSSVAGLVMGMCTGAIVFSEFWWDLFGYVSHKAIQLDNKVFYNILIPPIVFYAGFSVKKKLFFKNLVTIAIFGVLGCCATAGVLSACLYPVLKHLGLGNESPPAPPLHPPPLSLHAQPWDDHTSAMSLHHIQESEYSMRHLTSEREAPPTPDYPHVPPIASPHMEDPSTLSDQHADPPPAPGADPIGNLTLLQKAIRLGTVFSPTDNAAILHYLSPGMQPVIHSLLFGEDVMNDITAVVMLRSTIDMQTLTPADVFEHSWGYISLFLSSSFTGVTAGLLSAVITKSFFGQAHHHTDREVILMTAMAAMSYVMAMILDLSGILAVFFCGITMSHYTWHSISASARVMSVHNFRVLATVSEMFLFIYAGLDTSSKLSQRFASLEDPESAHFLLTALQLAVALLSFILVVRAAFVGIAVAIVNLWRSYKFTFREAIIMWYGGLVRGSITTALVYSYFYSPEHATQNDEVIVVAGVLVVVISTVFIGGLSGAFMRCFTLPPAQSRLIEINTLPSMVREDDTSINSAAVLSSKLHKLWRRFDKNIMQRLFGGRDMRMPGYFQSVAELNQQIMRGQENASSLPVSSMLPRHGLQQYVPVATSASSTTSTIQTADFQGNGESDANVSSPGAPYGNPQTPSPRPSMTDSPHPELGTLNRLPHVHSSSNFSVAPSHMSEDAVMDDDASYPTDLPTTISMLQQIDTNNMLRAYSDPRLNASIPGGSLQADRRSLQHSKSSLNDASLPPAVERRSLHGSSKSGASNDPPQPDRRSLQHSKTMVERRRPPPPSTLRSSPIIANPFVNAPEPTPSHTPAGASSASAASTPGLSNPSALRGSSASSTPSRREAPDAPILQQAAAMLQDSVLSSGPRQSTKESISSVEALLGSSQPPPLRPLNPPRNRDIDVAEAVEPPPLPPPADASSSRSEALLARPLPWEIPIHLPPPGPSAAVARRAGVDPELRLSALGSMRISSESGGGPTPAGHSSPHRGESNMVTMISGTADNLPEPYQPPPSTATSEDMLHMGYFDEKESRDGHDAALVGGVGVYSGEDALLDSTQGNMDSTIPWGVFDEADQKAASGSRSAMHM